MIRRRALLGVLTALVVSSAAPAKPPGEGGPLSEGRELDPVVRDYYLPTAPGTPAPARASARPAEKPGDTVGLIMAIVREFMIPPGTR
jgi:hypothetical protein